MSILENISNSVSNALGGSNILSNISNQISGGNGLGIGLAIFGLLFLRRLALFSLSGIVPLAAILLFLFSQDPQAWKMVQQTSPDIGGPSLYERLRSSQLFLPIAILAGLYVFNRIRTISLGGALALIVCTMLITGHSVQLPSEVSGTDLALPLVLLICLVVFFRLLARTRRYQIVPQPLYSQNSAPQYSPAWYPPQLPYYLPPYPYMPQHQIPQNNRTAAGPSRKLASQTGMRIPFSERPLIQKILSWLPVLASIFILLLLYFFPDSIQKHIPFWRASYSPYAYVLALSILCRKLQRSASLPLAEIRVN